MIFRLIALDLAGVAVVSARISWRSMPMKNAREIPRLRSAQVGTTSVSIDGAFICDCPAAAA
jgi:hypothetical protein